VRYSFPQTHACRAEEREELQGLRTPYSSVRDSRPVHSQSPCHALPWPRAPLRCLLVSSCGCSRNPLLSIKAILHNSINGDVVTSHPCSKRLLSMVTTGSYLKRPVTPCNSLDVATALSALVSLCVTLKFTRRAIPLRPQCCCRYSCPVC